MSGERALVLCEGTVTCPSAVDFVELAGELGFAGVSLRVSPGGPGSGALVAGSADLRAVAGALRATGLFVSEAQALVLADDRLPGDYLPALDAAAELGARAALVIDEESDRARAIGNYAALAEQARARGLRLVLEYMVYRALPSLAQAVAFVRAADPQGAGVMVDALHFTRAGDKLAGLRAAGPTIAGVQLCDGPATPPPWDRLRQEALYERLPPGEGVFDLAGFVRAVPAHLPLGIEVLNPAAQGSAGPAAWARRCRDATRALMAGL